VPAEWAVPYLSFDWRMAWASISHEPAWYEFVRRATPRQLALFEAGNGWQHGVIEILIALLAAMMFVPLGPFLRSGSKDRR